FFKNGGEASAIASYSRFIPFKNIHGNSGPVSSSRHKCTHTSSKFYFNGPILYAISASCEGSGNCSSLKHSYFVYLVSSFFANPLKRLLEGAFEGVTVASRKRMFVCSSLLISFSN